MKIRLWVSRVLILALVLVNLQVAFVYFLHPMDYLYSFELSGASGAAVVQGYGVLFTMWNIPYLIAAFHPIKYHLMLIAAILMQLTGLIGESIIYAQLPDPHTNGGLTIQRFIYFDAAGLILLLIVFFITKISAKETNQKTTPID